MPKAPRSSARLKLTPREREIAALIRKRHADGRPLNLSAMKREMPEFVAEVFTMRPFLGWRKALEAAGLSYEEILVNVEETIECRICGAERRSLTNHDRQVHHLEAGEYTREFPDAPMLAEAMMASRMAPAALVPHWEPT